MTTKELKRWMKKNDKGTAWVAAATGVTVRTIQRLVKGENRPSPLLTEALKKLTEIK